MLDLSRRSILQTTLAASAGFMVPLWAARKKIPIGVQLYSVSKQFNGDVLGTLAGVKKIGYDGVEFAGYADNDAKTLRKLLDDNGLACCGSHIQLNTMIGDELQKTIEFNQILGNKYLVVPMMPREHTKSIDGWAKAAELFNGIAEKVTPLGMHIGYHNHSMEFQSMEGQTPWDVFLGKANKNVFMQLDIGHCLHGGGDPVAVLHKYAGRAITVHVKEWSPTNRAALVGEGEVQWPDVFEACESVGGTEWYIIEEESRSYEGLEGIDRSIRNLKKLLG